MEELFQSIGIPVLAKHTKVASKVEAQDAIALVTRILRKRIPKMPFPSATKVGHLDYDALTKSNVSIAANMERLSRSANRKQRELQQRLRTAADSIATSKAELEKQKLQLQNERRELQRLEHALEDGGDQSRIIPPLDEMARTEDMPTAIGLAAG